MRVLEEQKMNETILFNELELIEDFEEDNDGLWIIFEELFDRGTGEYVITGSLGLWDGRHEVYCDEIFSSLTDAINKTINGDCYVTVKEGKYGKLMVDIAHHDGTNHFEIKELTSKGKEMMDNNYCGDICKVKGATRNVRFMKNYM